MEFEGEHGDAFEGDDEHDPLLGDKQHIRKSFARHIVATILADFPGRNFEDLAILELGAGAGFFAKSYAEVFPGAQLKHLVQTDASPRGAGVVALDVGDLASPPDVEEALHGRQFDAVLSIDFLSCLSFGAGLDPEDEADVDALGQLNEGLLRVLQPGCAFYDFMACVPNSQFVMRFVPDFCASHPGWFISVLDPGDEELLFVTFEASRLRHEAGEGEGEPLLCVAGHRAALTYNTLCEEIRRRLVEEGQWEPRTEEEEREARAFAKKVLTFLFRDINSGGCAGNWELLSYVSVDVAHFNEVFEEEGEHLCPVFLETFAGAVRFLRDTFRGQDESYVEVITVVEAFRSTVATYLSKHAVQSDEVDVAGANGAYYTQRYDAQFAETEGDPEGEGSFRCMLTKARARA
jgi:hypothetical protein